MPAYSTDWFKRLNQLRETNPDAARQIEQRADEIFTGYSEAETYSKGGRERTPGAPWTDWQRSSRARAMEQAMQEYERMAGATGITEPELPEEDPFAGLPEEDPLAGLPEVEEEQPDVDRQRPAPKRPTTPIAEAESQDRPDDVELSPFAMDDIKDLEDPTLLQRLGRFAGSDQGLAILQALAKGGQAYMGGRAQSEANQQMRQSQARANLINALSSRAGARGVTEQPRMGKLGTLFGTLADVGGGLREERTLERERGRKQKEFQALEDYRAEQQEIKREGQEITLRKQEEAGKRREEDAQLKADKITADGLSDMVANMVGMGQAKTMDQFFELNPDAQVAFNKLSKPYQGIVLSGFTRGLKDYTKEAAKRGTGTDADQVGIAVEVLKGVWDDIDYQGNFKSLARETFRRVLPELWAGYVQPAETTYMAERAGLSLPIASAFNDGRPSNADAEAVLRMLPKVGEAKPVVDRKWQALEELIQLKREIEEKGIKLAPDQQDFLTRGVIVPKGGGYVIDKEKAFELLEQYAVGLEEPSVVEESENSTVYDPTLKRQKDP
ncbi:rho guanine nucleotide exchange factor 18 [uncultured Mediterranean phage uvDeep-CGR2-KM23-C246]|nr:rho guanine nucleotide exchange factor 18 [uncultured Mediterranean phage uvDeep-CGR2-KM23-C246]